MDLRTKQESLADSLLVAAKELVGRVDPSLHSELYRLASNARHGIAGSARDWKPFERLLNEARILRGNRNHVTAIMLQLIPYVIEQDKFKRFAAATEARGRKKPRDTRDEFLVSTATDASIDKGAKRFPLALERLAKK